MWAIKNGVCGEALAEVCRISPNGALRSRDGYDLNRHCSPLPLSFGVDAGEALVDKDAWTLNSCSPRRYGGVAEIVQRTVMKRHLNIRRGLALGLEQHLLGDDFMLGRQAQPIVSQNARQRGHVPLHVRLVPGAVKPPHRLLVTLLKHAPPPSQCPDPPRCTWSPDQTGPPGALSQRARS